ncbi:MAG: HAMP domain-containing sensor histidine kinase [Actinomycetota bacterium]
MSLRLRLALLFGVLVAVGIGIASVSAYLATDDALGDEIDGFLRTRAQEINEGVRTAPVGGPEDRRGGRDDDPPADGPDDSLEVDSLLDLFSFDADSIIQVINADGEVEGSDGGVLPVSQSDLELAASPGRETFRDITIDFVDYRMITRHLDGGGAVQVARELEETQRILARLGTTFVWIGVAVSVVAAIAGWLVARRTTKPLRRLSTAAREIADTQDLATPIPVAGRDEVGTLAESLSTMTEALATSREQQRRLVMDAGHELRTPLTSIRANVEFLERIGDADPAQRREVVDAVTLEVEELSALITELVELATDSRDDDVPAEPVVLAGVVDTAVQRFRRRSARTVSVQVDDSVVMGRPPLLDRALTNLLGNADKFTPDDAPIEVDVRAGAVRVRDHGPGFPAEDLPHVWERFYRSAATRTMPGSGLGLAIVAQIVERHGGRVHASNAADGGAIVGFDLPLEPD